MSNTIPRPVIPVGAATVPTITPDADLVVATSSVVIDAEVIGDTTPPEDSVVDHPVKEGEGGDVGTVSGMDVVEGGGGGESGVDGVVEKREPDDCEMVEVEDDVARSLYESSSSSTSSPATVFRIRLKQTPSNLTHKMRVPGLCRNFSAVAWCGKLNIISCASETCARIPSSNANPPFWIPIYILNPERPTECAVFNITADSPRDSVQFMEWSPRSSPRALLIANFHGRATIWTQPSQSSPNLIRDGNFWEREHEWRQDLVVTTKWLSGITPYRCFPSNSTLSACSKSTFEEKFFCKQPQISGRWPNFLCVCSIFSSGSVQLHWSQWPPPQNGQSKWFSSSKGLLGAGPSGIMVADAIITDAGTMHVAGVPIVNPSTVVVWEVIPGPGNVLQTCAKINISSAIPSSLNNKCTGIASLAAYLFSWQDYLLSDGKEGKKSIDQDLHEAVSLHCSPVSNFSAYVSPELAPQSAASTTWGSGVTAVSFDPTRGGSVISVAIVEEFSTLYPDGVSERISQKQVGRKLYPQAGKPSFVKRLRKIVVSKPLQEPTIELEVGEIQEVPVLPQKPDELKKRTPVCTSALPQKRPRTFEQGSTSHPPLPLKDPLPKPIYHSTYDDQNRGYTSFHPTNYGSRAPFIPDTDASQAALKKISMLGLDKLVEELAQNLANLDHLYKGGFAALAGIRNHHTIVDEITTLKGKLKSSESRATDLGNINSYLHLQDRQKSADISCKELRIKELEEKNRKIQVEHTAANTAKTNAEATTTLQKSLADSLEISLSTANLTISQLKGEQDVLKSSQTSVADLLIKYDKQTEELNYLRCKYDELRMRSADNDDYLQGELKRNIDDYNNLVQFGPILYPDFDADEVLKWVVENPERVEKLQLEWAEDEVIEPIASEAPSQPLLITLPTAPIPPKMQL